MTEKQSLKEKVKKVDKRLDFYFGIFLTVFAAIVVAVYLFAPERLPAGLGLSSIPVKIHFRDSIIGNGKVAVITNCSDKALSNICIECEEKSGKKEEIINKDFIKASGNIEVGWVQGWAWNVEDSLTISASGYLSKTYTLHQNNFIEY